MKLLRQTIQRIIQESYVPDYRYLYHGTTEEAAEAIEDTGFDVSLVGTKSGDKFNPGVSFTINGEMAAEHALWALGGNFEKGAALVVVSTNGLNLMRGSEFNALWDSLGDQPKAVETARQQGYDGVEYFDLETGNGIEEMEVLLLNICSKYIVITSRVATDQIKCTNPQTTNQNTDTNKNIMIMR